PLRLAVRLPRRHLQQPPGRRLQAPDRRPADGPPAEGGCVMTPRTLTLADCLTSAAPGRVTLALPGGRLALVLTADELVQLECLTRDEPDPAPAAGALDFMLTVCDCGEVLYEHEGEWYCPSCTRFTAA